ncbi:MAG: peptidylprolyl isomerase [DPANN group archaeon]|nr:peptidylprolyl isomerase [DPANN group archaeon]
MTNEKTAQNGDTVKVHYTGRLKDGTVFDSSEGRDPLQVTLGSSMVIPGFNDGILNMKIGEKKTVEIPVDQAYGPVDPMRFMNVEPAELPGAEVGRMIQANNGMIGVITEVYPDRIVVDFNHQLAGKDLIFEIELVEIA